jgi:hypothetical protein
MRRLLGLLMMPVLVVAGCGPDLSKGGAPAAPHGGIIASVPGDKGFAEIIVAPAGGPGKARIGQQVKSQIAAYFYQSDGTTEMSPAPTDVKVKVGTAAGSPTLTLSPDPKDKGKFVSEPADVPEGFRGQLEAAISGESVQVPFAIR